MPTLRVIGENERGHSNGPGALDHLELETNDPWDPIHEEYRPKTNKES